MKLCILLTWLQSSWKHFEVYIRDNRKFDFRRVWKFCWGLSNVISGDNWLSRWDCVFSGGILYPSSNYELTWHIYHLSFEKNEGGRGRKQKSTKKCYEIRKISTFLLRRVGGGGCGVWRGESSIFTKKANLNLKCLTTKTVHNFFLCHY